VSARVPGPDGGQVARLALRAGLAAAAGLLLFVGFDYGVDHPGLLERDRGEDRVVEARIREHQEDPDTQARLIDLIQREQAAQESGGDVDRQHDEDDGGTTAGR